MLTFLKRLSGYLPRPRWCWLHWLWRLPLLWLACVIVVLLWHRFMPVHTSAFMLQQQFVHYWNGAEPAVRQQWVNYADIKADMALAIIAAEDQLFPQHHGIDIQATRYAIKAAWSGRKAGGGSTITQQVAKNMFLWGGRSYVRKALEWVLAGLIELLWDKQRILEVYLNIAQFSDRDYGVGAASRNLLDKQPGKLRRRETALLAAVLPAPTRYRVNKPSGVVRKRQRHILRQMRLLGGVEFLERLEN